MYQCIPFRRSWLGGAVRGGLIASLALAFIASAWGNWTQGTKGSWKFVVMGDHRSKTTINIALDDYVEGGVNVGAVQALGSAVRREGADFVLNVGDFVAKYDNKLVNVPGATPQEKAQNYITAKLALFTAVWNAASGNMPIYPVRGNHESSAPAAAWINSVPALPGIGSLPQCSPPGQEWLTYAFTHKNCLFVGLDVFPAGAPKLPTLTESTLDWLGEVFAESDRPHVFVWSHVPAYEVWDTERPGFSRDGLASPRAPVCVLDTNATLNVRNRLWNLLGSEGSKAYFCGHDHLYARGVAADIQQVIIGNGGAPAYPKYPEDLFVESPTSTVDNWGSPRITAKYVDQTGSIYRDDPSILNYGYVVVEIHGSHATATYKVKVKESDEFVAADTWTWKITDGQ